MKKKTKKILKSYKKEIKQLKRNINSISIDCSQAFDVIEGLQKEVSDIKRSLIEERIQNASDKIISFDIGKGDSKTVDVLHTVKCDACYYDSICKALIKECTSCKTTRKEIQEIMRL